MHYGIFSFRTLIIVSLFFSPLVQGNAFAYTFSSTENGNPIRWMGGQKYFLAGNEVNRSNISPAQFWNAIVNGLQQWKWASGSGFEFEYWQGSNSAIYETSLGPDGLSTVFFASQGNVEIDPNVIGYTQTWYDTQTGELLEADMVLNDQNFVLTSNPSDTTSQSSSYGTPRVYLNNIVTHELGHAAGLSHSTDINSSMLYVEFREQSKVGCDDWSAIRHLYSGVSPVDTQANLGTLTGTILTPQSEPASGVLVTAISKTRGTPLATVHTDGNGNFKFGALESGEVALMLRAYDGSSGSIPNQSQAKEQSICNGNRYFPTNFITESNENSLSTFRVQPSQNTSTGSYRLSCENINSAKSNDSNFFVNSEFPGQSQTYHFYSNGPFKITATSFLLSSAVQAQVQVFTESGVPVSTQTQSPLYSSSSLYSIPDVSVTGNYVGNLQVVVQTEYFSSGSFPSPSVNPDSDPYYVVSFGQTDQRAPASSELPNNARCATSENFGDYQSPPGNPLRSGFGTNRDVVGFCGSIQNIEKSTRLNGNHHQRRMTLFEKTRPEVVLGWMFPFLVAIAYQFARSLARKSSLKKSKMVL